MRFMREPFRKVRSDKEIGNIKDLPKEATKGHRKDMQLGTLLDEHRVGNKEELKRKFRRQHRLEKFNQRTD